MKLHLGVIDQPYANGGVTTAQVAGWLENKYHIMELFYHFHEREIADALTAGLQDALEAHMMGAPITLDPFQEAFSNEEAVFKMDWLALGGVEKVGIPGVPTQRALDRESLRLKKKKKDRGPARPSFIDTGLYQSSFKMWMEDG